VRVTDHDGEDTPVVERVLEPEPFPYCAELVLAEHILRLHLKEAAGEQRTAR
jgi:hypothetical protein